MFEKTLLDELLRFTKKDFVRAHMPGHNGGAGLSGRFRRNAFKIDVTELEGTDNLQCPSGIIKKSEENAAEVFGAEQTMFLVNGSTAGIEAAILAAAGPGDKLIVDRCCHKSVISAMIMAGITPVFIEPDFSDSFGIYGAMQPLTVMDAMHANPDAAGVVITSPTYYGVCSPIRQLADNIHRSGMPLIVDEAHGAHFAFSDTLPETALSQGADVVVQSAHKMLASPGQTAMLHIGRGSRISAERVRECVNLLQTSSPSYMLLAGLDLAVRSIDGHRKGFEALIEKIVEIKARIGVLDNVRCLVKSGLENDYDMMKLVVDFSSLEISGCGAAELLKKDYGIYTEAADERNVLFYLTAGTTMKDLELIDRAITDISKTEFMPQTLKKPSPLPSIRMKADMSRAFRAPKRRVSAEAAMGEICAEILNCCPPCVPIAVPGQLIDAEIVKYITAFTDISEISVVDAEGVKPQ